MNYSYGHLDEHQKIIYASSSVTVDGKTYIKPTAEIYLLASPPEKLLKLEQPENPAPAGFHYVQKGYVETATEISIDWELAEDAPLPHSRVFSKMYLELALFKAGLLAQVD